MKRAANHPEILDGPALEPRVLHRSLTDLRRLNRLLGGAALSSAALVRLAPDVFGPGDRAGGGSPRTLTLLDVGTGLADIPVALLAFAHARGVELAVEAVDARHETVALAREEYAGVAGLRFAVAEGRSLPYPDASFDVAHSSLVGHHLEPDELRVFLTDLKRVSRRGVIMNDVDRNVIAFAGAWLLSRLFTRNPITRHDAPLSIRRAYRAPELARIALSAGLREVARLRAFPGYRYAAVFVPTAREPDTTAARMEQRG